MPYMYLTVLYISLELPLISLDFPFKELEAVLNNSLPDQCSLLSDIGYFSHTFLVQLYQRNTFFISFYLFIFNFFSFFWGGVLFVKTLYTDL